jgi:hypothetical protein
MKVSIKRSGGFAGLSDDLGSAAGSHQSALGEAVRRLKARAGVEEHLGADLFRYEVTVDEGGASQTLTVQDADPPISPSLRELLGLVRS